MYFWIGEDLGPSSPPNFDHLKKPPNGSPPKFRYYYADTMTGYYSDDNPPLA
jgi:hypothetical protein